MSSPFEWTYDMILQLIDEYKNRPILWDRDHKHFRNGDRKMRAWADMAAVFNLRETWEVKKKMNSLLASYRRERHKIRAKTTKPGENIVSTWFGFKALDSFLHEKYLDASQRYAAQDEDGTDFDSLEPEAQMDFIKIESPGPVVFLNDEDLTISNGVVEQDAEDSGHPKKRQRVSEDPLRFKQHHSSTSVKSSMANRDDCDVFGEYISGKMKHLDHKSKCVVEYLVSNILFQADMGKFRDDSFDFESLVGPFSFSGHTSSYSNRTECNQNQN